MKRLRPAVAAVLILLAVAVHAHEGGTHVMGTVTTVNADNLVVRTRDGRPVSIRVTPDTLYRQKGGGTDQGALKAGDRVVVEVIKEGDRLTAREIQFASVEKTTRQ